MIARKFLQDKHEQIMMELLFPVLFFFPPLTNLISPLLGAIEGVDSIVVIATSLDVENENEDKTAGSTMVLCCKNTIASCKKRTFCLLISAAEAFFLFSSSLFAIGFS